MTDFSRVSAGDSAHKAPTNSASWINAVSEVAEDFQSRKETGEAGGSGRALKTSSGLVSVKNLTGGDLLRGEYVQLGDYLLTAVNHRRFQFEGNLYDPDEKGKIAILTKAAKQNVFEAARTIGPCTARINITDTGHRFAKPEDGLTVLQSAASGPVEILSVNKVSGTGEQELTVLLGGGDPPTPIQLAQIIAVITAGTSPHYNAAGSLPEDIAHAVIVSAVLLANNEAVNDGIFEVDNPGSEPLEDIAFVALDVRREGLPKVDDIVRVWTSTGKPVQSGQSSYESGEFVDQDPIYCEPINSVEELRGLTTWDLGTDQVLVHAADTKELEWMEAEAFVSGPGGGTTGGGGVTSIVAGYGMDVSGTTTVTVIADPTEWTGWSATEFQFFGHLDTATTGVVTDPLWITCDDYDATKNQMWWHQSGTFKFKTTLTYDAAKNQQLVSVAGSWQWLDAWTVKCTIDDSTASFLHDAIKDNATYVSGQDGIVAAATDGAAATNQKERLFLDSSVITGFNAATAQALTHDASGNLKWVDITDCTGT